MTVSSTVTKRLPAALIFPFVKEYVFRTLKILPGEAMLKAMPLRCLSSIDFFIGDTFETFDHASAQLLPFSVCTIRGPRTFRKNYIRISGNFASFSIRFQPAGLYNLLGIPADLLRDQAIDGAMIHLSAFPEMAERLMSCNDIDSCIAIVEPYLLQLAQKNSGNARRSTAVDQLAALITDSRVPESISQLQQHVYLSPRQLERNFLREIGTSPKLYSRMIRFSNMIAYKRHRADTKWCQLAYEFHYADQAHLIKDFQQFLGTTPGDFSPNDFAF